jgi:ATP-binding cassette, subfamily B, putative efflux pump
LNSIKRYLAFVTPYKKEIIFTFIIGILKFGIPLLIPLLLKYVLDDIIISTQLTPDEKMNQLLPIMAGVFFIFLIVRPPVEYYRQYFAQWTGSKVLYDIRDRLFAHIQKLSLRFYSNNKVGEVISRVIHDVEQTKSFVITGLMNIWLDMVTIIIAISIMMWMDFWLTIVAISLFPLYGFAVKYFYAKLRRLTRERSQSLAEVQGHLHERIQGISVIKSFANENYEHEQFKGRNDNFLNKALNHTSWNAKTSAVVNTITDIAPIIVIFVASIGVLKWGLSVGTLVAFVAYMDKLYNPLRRLVNSSTTLTQAIASMDRVFEFMDEEYDIVDRPNAKELKNVNGEIAFKNVSFKYSEENKNVLSNINLNVKAGETIALVGMSGGGKSSLVGLIPRFYDIDQGEILLDGIDIRDFTVTSLRDKIGVVLQDNILFSESVMTNIMMGNPNAPEEEVIEAAKAANAHEFILNLPEGYDTKIGERGVKLSGGQKQRLAIARVFLKNPPLLIFDEATSALDLESEQYIQEALERLAKDRTTFIVAHRLATITHADRIILIENGEIKEEGTHLELMNKKGSYYDLFQVQHLE